MHGLSILKGGAGLRVLALGAHADDIEIGCGGTILRLASEAAIREILWVVLCATPNRAAEAHASAHAFLANVPGPRVLVRDHRDGFLPYDAARVKEEFELLKGEFSPDLILTHRREDLHQDHRLVAELTWNTWRNHFILEYEIPKYDGDFGSPNFFAPLSSEILEKKSRLVLEHFPSQAGKHWFSADLMRAIARIRGMECVAPEGFAEGFYCRKAVF